jgi:acetone carboxylase gamma subunit
MTRTHIVINENLILTCTGGGPRYVCGCGHELAPGDSNFKNGCKTRENPVDAIGPGYASFNAEMMNKMRFREFFCPGCGARLATEIARAGDGYLWDIQLRL